MPKKEEGLSLSWPKQQRPGEIKNVSCITRRRPALHCQIAFSTVEILKTFYSFHRNQTYLITLYNIKCSFIPFFSLP